MDRTRPLTRHNAFIGLFDRPVHRDWVFWFSALWVVVAVASVLFPSAEAVEAPPVWLMVWLSPLVIFGVVCVPVAALRRVIRSALAQRHEPRSQRADDNPVAPPVTAPPVAAPPVAAPPVAAPLPHHPPPARAKPAAVEPPVARAMAPGQLPARPTPLPAWSGDQAKSSDRLSEARETFPYPVARAARAVQAASDPLEQYQHALDMGEALTISLGIVSASWLRVHEPDHPVLVRLRDRMVGPGLSQGTWREVTDAARIVMGRSPAALPGFADGTRMRPRNTGLLVNLQRLVEERNRAAHGSRPHNRAEAAVRTADLLRLLEESVEYASFLTKSDWVLIENSSLRRHDARFDVRLRRAMGDHPEFDAQTMTFDHALANETFYVIGQSGVIDLTPLLVLRYCEQCRQPEMCHADRVIDGREASLRSFGRGHQVFATELVPELMSIGGQVDQPRDGFA